MDHIEDTASTSTKLLRPDQCLAMSVFLFALESLASNRSTCYSTLVVTALSCSMVLAEMLAIHNSFITVICQKIHAFLLYVAWY